MTIVHNIKFTEDGETDRQTMVRGVINWCFDHLDLSKFPITVNVKLMDDLDCWGNSRQNDFMNSEYSIEIYMKQSLRDIIATVCHEMVHIKQWYTDTWDGDGEKEAERLQYKMADAIWKDTKIL